jgi:hypothetical protein
MGKRFRFSLILAGYFIATVYYSIVEALCRKKS